MAEEIGIPKPLIGVFLGCGALGLVGTLVTAALSVAGVLTMTVAAVLLAIAWVVSVGAMICADVIWQKPEWRLPTGIAASIGLAIVYGLLGMWIYNFRQNQPTPGPHYEFLGIAVESKDGKFDPVLHIENTSDIAATSYAARIFVFPSALPNDEKNSDIEAKFNEALESVRKFDVTPLKAFMLTRGYGVDINLPGLTRKMIDDINSGDRAYYMIILVKASNQPHPMSRYWVTESCTHIKKLQGRESNFSPCMVHNQYYETDGNLNRIY